MQGDWLSLWAEKAGLKEPDDLSDNIAVQLGIHTESFNLKWFEKQTGFSLTGQQLEFEETIGTVPAKGTIDAMAYSERGLVIVEAKHTNMMNHMDAVIERYMPQIQLYAHLAKASGIFLSVIFGNNKWDRVYVAYNAEYFNSMWAVVSDFWSYVVRNKEPIAVDLPHISLDEIEVDNMVVRDASRDNAFIDAANTYIENESSARLFESAKSDLKNMVADNEREVYCDLITIKRDKRGSLRITRRRT